MTPPKALHWPQSLDAQGFLDRYWQKRPLLIRAALPGFETPLPPDELAGLSLEPGTTPRLIIENPTSGEIELEHGPFDENRFEQLVDARFSLLVTDVEKHLPEIQAWLEPFRFLPDWRIDDLMISYAPDGGSVGAHIDEYDVFLLQASGRRHWSIDTRAGVVRESASQRELRLVDDFQPDESWLLEPGDLLYLPPGVPHHGVAVGDDCTTWSIGFRAPRRSDIIAGISELLEEELQIAGPASVSDAVHGRQTDDRYRDPALRIARPGEIAPEALVELRRIWDDATRLEDAHFASIVGRLLTQPSGSPGPIAADLDDPADDLRTFSVRRSGFARIAWIAPVTRLPPHDGRSSGTEPGDRASVTLFADGEAMACSRSLALLLATKTADSLATATLDDGDFAVVRRLLELGTLEQSPD